MIDERTQKMPWDSGTLVATRLPRATGIDVKDGRSMREGHGARVGMVNVVNGQASKVGRVVQGSTGAHWEGGSREKGPEMRAWPPLWGPPTLLCGTPADVSTRVSYVRAVELVEQTCTPTYAG